jgi:hypothetical protein
MSTDNLLEDIIIDAGFSRDAARVWLKDLAQKIFKNSETRALLFINLYRFVVLLLVL